MNIFWIQGCGEGFVTYVNALCNWNRLDDLLDLIEQSLLGALRPDQHCDKVNMDIIVHEIWLDG